MDTPARFAVLDRCPGVAVRFQPRPGGFLELVHHAAELRIARVVLRCPGDDPRRVLVLELQPIGHGGHLVRMAPQHFDFFRVLLLLPVLILVLILFGGEVLLAGEVVRRCRSRPGSASEKLDHHRGSPSTAKVSSARSMATRCVTTSITSAFSLWILAQRAIWFRFDPIRASSRVRSRSSSVCATVQVRTRPTERRTRSESDNPTEWALACHSDRSASLARIFTQTSRRALMMLLSLPPKMGVEGGQAPSPIPCRGSREAWPKRVGWLCCGAPSISAIQLVLPSELVGATIVVQSRNGQSWTATVTAVLDRGSRQVIVTDSGRLSEP